MAHATTEGNLAHTGAGSPKTKHSRFRQFLVFIGVACVLGVSFAFAPAIVPAAPVSSASATNPVVTSELTCPVPGFPKVTWFVQGDTGYPDETATVVTQSLTTNTSFVDSSVQGAEKISAVQTEALAGNTYTMVVQVQWTNHDPGNLVSAENSVTIPSDYCNPPAEHVNAAPTVTIIACSGDPDYAIVGANWITVIAHPAVSGYIEKLGGETFIIEPGAGFNGAPPFGPGQYNIEINAFESDEYIVDQLSTPAEFPDPAVVTAACVPPRDAVAAVAVLSVESCTAPSTVGYGALFNAFPTNSLQTAPGSYYATFGSPQGHQFADGTSTASIPYEIKAADPSKCPQVVVPTFTPYPGTCTDTGYVFYVYDSAKMTPSTPPNAEPGDHTVTFTIKDGLTDVFPTTFAKTFVLNYTVPDKIPATDPSCITEVIVDKLASTGGGGVPMWIPLSAGAVLVLGAGLIAMGRRSRKASAIQE